MDDKKIRGLGCLDTLFENVRRYRQSGQAKALFEFAASFPKLAPLNALLVHLQQPDKACRLEPGMPEAAEYRKWNDAEDWAAALGKQDPQ